ncbi:MAG: serine/threonine protein kinase [Clostridia bacterium]|nr:serine/threonine protein kinase [Clostridia bacterium]
MEVWLVNGKEYEILCLLGKGKGGYSYLARRNGAQVVVKQIHHEPCAYYTFGDKIAAERNDYRRLTQAGIRMPRLIEIDEGAERIVKEYIEGSTVYDLVRWDQDVTPYLAQVRQMAAQARQAGLNIDYFPTNFVARAGLLYYVDYECNDYMAEWNFDNWGVQYWSKTPAFLQYDAERP